MMSRRVASASANSVELEDVGAHAFNLLVDNLLVEYVRRVRLSSPGGAATLPDAVVDASIDSYLTEGPRMMRPTALGAIGMLLFACGGPIWTDDSESIEVEYFSYEEGSYLFTRDAEDLSPEQLRLVRAIRTIDPGDQGCAEDVPEVDLSVRGRSGASREYRATTHPCAEFGGLLVDYGQVAALLKTASCLPAKAPGTESLATAPHIAVGDGCSHGLFSPASRKEYWLLVNVEDQGPHRFAVEHCAACVLDLELFDESGETMLAKAQPNVGESSGARSRVRRGRHLRAAHRPDLEPDPGRLLRERESAAIVASRNSLRRRAVARRARPCH